jgi:hypothetical protein
MAIRDDIEEVKNELNEVKSKSFAYELLQDEKRKNKIILIVFSIAWSLTFLALIGVTYYTIYLLNDIGTVSDEYTQEINNVDSIDNSSISNGGGN